MCSVSPRVGNTGRKTDDQSRLQVEGGVYLEDGYFSSLGPKTRGTENDILNLKVRPEDFSSIR